ncbi:MAG: formylglycine-generating enzyme family protein [Proteobacteria bacterium]|nr:formylglycine-generating enzyme family protein [Pseudomonadota bacterium]
MRVFIHIFAVLAWLSGIAQHSHGSEFVHIPGGEFRSVIPQAEGDNLIEVAEFLVQEAPVTNGEFLQFVLHHEDWRRGNAVALFADGQYLSTWSGPISLPPEPGQQQPVTQVSWFAANAYCEWKNARLPSWYEWEYIAAANETMADARVLPEWRQNILSWYSRSGGGKIGDIRGGKANYYEVFDTHGLIWEWVDDFNAFLVSGDNREQGGADRLQFCGAGAITMEEKENYATLMRIAMLSALEASYTTRNLGFRCARQIEVGQ